MKTLLSLLCLSVGCFAQAKLPNPCYVWVFTGPFFPSGTPASQLVNCSLFTTTTTPSLQVNGNVAQMSGAHHSVITWAVPVNTTVSGFHVWRSDFANGPFVVIGSTTSTSQIFSDVGVPGVTAYYKISAFDSTNKDFSFSNVLTITTPKTPPTSIVATSTVN